MAGKRFSFTNPNPRSTSTTKPFLIVVLFSIIAIFFIISSLKPNHNPDPNPNPDTDPDPNSNTSSISRNLIFHEEFDKFPASPNPICTPSSSSMQISDLNPNFDSNDGSTVLRVYVYVMPSKFTCDLLKLFKDTYKETTNLTSNGSPVHRLIEQHSIDYFLWADLIAPEKERKLKNVIRVYKQNEADLFYIPFFTTISFFLLETQQCKALYREALQWVLDQPAWKRYEGKDHILPIHHPWSFKSVRKFMKNAIWLLPDLDSTGKWYKPGQACLAKDVILPYVPNVEICDDKCLFETKLKRKTLLFFRGRLKRNAGGKIRSKLGEVLNGVEGVVIQEGTAGEAGKELAQIGMRSSLFCLSPAGDTPSSARLFDAIVSGCIPLIVSDELDPPFQDLIDYNKIALFVKSNDAIQPGWLVNYLKGIDSAKIKEMQSNLAKHSKHFIYSSPAIPLGAEDFTWQMISRKLKCIKSCIRWSKGIDKEPKYKCTCNCPRSNSTRSNLLL